jgi:3',5'-nucleoside bisphosphate phosphatase
MDSTRTPVAADDSAGDAGEGGRHTVSDWHVHTDLSDGFASPEEVVRAALDLGLTRISVTDHDCIEAHRSGRLKAAATATPLEIITGVEIDCTLGETGIEILGFGFDPDAPALVECLREIQADRRRRYEHYREVLRAAGEPVPPEPGTMCASLSLMKVHVYRALDKAQRHFAGGYREFSKWLDGLGDPPPVRTPTAADAARLILDAGGHVLLAHPLYYEDRIELATLVRVGREIGGVGTEFLYPYAFGDNPLPEETVMRGFARLRALMTETFPAGACLTAGTDVHDLTEWPARLAHLDQLHERLAALS